MSLSKNVLANVDLYVSVIRVNIIHKFLNKSRVEDRSVRRIDCGVMSSLIHLRVVFFRFSMYCHVDEL